jgi:hypothetical protein
MNPTIDKKFLRQEETADPEAYRREFLAEFVDSISCLFTPEATRNCIIEGVTEMARQPGSQHFAFFDGASGGPGGDSAALGIAARTNDGRADLLCCREWVPPFSPSGVVAECAEVLRSYGLSVVTSDRYSPGWCSEAFTKAGIGFRASDKTKSDIYREAIGPINSGRVRLLDNRKLVEQVASLERRVARGSGLETIDHPVGAHQHDDLANVACGAIVQCFVNRGLGLLEFYKEQADEARAREREGPRNPSLQESGKAQVEMLGEEAAAHWRFPDAKESITLSRKEPPVCPQCSSGVARYESFSKCFSCGWESHEEKPVTTSNQMEVIP